MLVGKVNCHWTQDCVSECDLCVWILDCRCRETCISQSNFYLNLEFFLFISFTTESVSNRHLLEHQRYRAVLRLSPTRIKLQTALRMTPFHRDISTPYRSSYYFSWMRERERERSKLDIYSGLVSVVVVFVPGRTSRPIQSPQVSPHSCASATAKWD